MTWSSFIAGASSPDEMLTALAAALSIETESLVHDADPLRLVLELIQDTERRCVLQLACLRQQPKITTPCCNAPYCFKCKVGSHHISSTCEQIQRDNMDQEVEFCPKCNVPTLRTEGCRHMVCLCGEHWYWEGGDDSDLDLFG